MSRENRVSDVPKRLDDLPSPVKKEFKTILESFADLIEGEKILDAGCG